VWKKSSEGSEGAVVRLVVKVTAPAQVKVDPDAAKRQLIHLSLQKLLSALEEGES
jgi:hypothetical protein